MTAQVPDLVRIEGQPVQVPDFLSFPVAEVEGVRRLGAEAWSSGCWRGYAATWELREGRVWLAALDGQWSLREGPPLLAGWVSGLYRLPLARGRTRDPAARPAQLLELDVHAGVIVRQRRAPAGRGAAGRAWWEAAHWTRLPGAGDLFARRARKDPDEGRPDPQQFLGLHLREEFVRCRERARRSYGDIMQRTGRQRTAGGGLAEWERGQRRFDAAWVRAVCDAVGMEPARREALEAREQAGLAAAFERWASRPLRPQLTLALDPDMEDLGQVTYEAPDHACTDEPAALAWASACCALAWRPGALRLSRGLLLRLDGHGREVERIPLGPRRQP
ncbi:MAG: hypothetical protein ACKOCB_09695 [Planctomycetia bacterium]